MFDAHPTYERIYDLAEDLVRERGVHFVFQHLENRAGAGSGGLRHHFPTKDHVIAAYARDDFTQLVVEPASLSDRTDVRTALNEWAYQVAEWSPRIYGVADKIIRAVRDEKAALHAFASEIIASVEELLRSARAAGVVKVDTSDEEFVVTILSAAATADALIGGPPPETYERRIAKANEYLESFLLGVMWEHDRPAS